MKASNYRLQRIVCERACDVKAKQWNGHPLFIDGRPTTLDWKRLPKEIVFAVECPSLKCFLRRTEKENPFQDESTFEDFEKNWHKHVACALSDCPFFVEHVVSGEE
jgi:hypothetical protein